MGTFWDKPGHIGTYGTYSDILGHTLTYADRDKPGHIWMYGTYLDILGYTGHTWTYSDILGPTQANLDKTRIIWTNRTYATYVIK